MMHVAETGAAGVHIFFVISGFIMVYSSFPHEASRFRALDFANKRAVRIFPVYILYCFLYLAIYAVVLNGKNLSIVPTLLSLCLWPGYSGLIIGPGWTLSFEVYFYIAFFIFMKLGLRGGLVGLSLFFVASIFAGHFLDRGNPVIHVMTNSLLIEFLIGAWIGYGFIAGIQISRPVLFIILAGAFVGFFSGVPFNSKSFPTVLFWGAPSILLVASLVFIERHGPLPKIVSRLSKLGASSYSLYLLHILLIDLFLRFLSARFEWTSLTGPIASAVLVLLVLAAWMISQTVAVIAYEIIERKLITMFRRSSIRSKDTSISYPMLANSRHGLSASHPRDLRNAAESEVRSTPSETVRRE
uniref:Acyltransferase 3 n=1 Tax=Rhodopseudomonas palustris (strain BisA53) TaxID=316055 RepID=Q07SM1_RHOP5